MARTRDVVIGVIIVFTFLAALGFFGLAFIGMYSGGGDMEFAGLGDKVGIVEMFGIIDEQSGRPVIAQLEKWTDNNSIKAVVVHINSPGGGVAISQEIYDALLRLRDEKPVVASMASVAASGGYYIACATDRVVANPGTITGSIGVIFSFHTFENLMQKIGVGTETIKSGELKDVGSYSREMSGQEELMLKGVVMDTYEQFVQAVADGRGMEKEQIYPLADGSIYTGLQALNLGLVDTLGGLKEAVDIAADLAEIDGDPDVVRPYERKKVGLWDVLGTFLGDIPASFRQDVVGPKLMYLYQ